VPWDVLILGCNTGMSIVSHLSIMTLHQSIMIGLLRVWSALSLVWKRLGYVCGMGREESADSVREMYFSRFGLDAGGGEWLFAKKVFDSERSGESLIVRP